MLAPVLVVSLFAVMMWLVYFPGAIAVRGSGFLLSGNPKQDPQPLPSSTTRWIQAHQNMMENLPSFIAICIAAEVSGYFQPNWLIAGYLFCIARFLHFVFYGLGIPYLRTLMFMTGWLCTLYIGFGLLLRVV